MIGKTRQKILQNYLLPKRGYLELKASVEQRKCTKGMAMSEFSRGDPSRFSFMFRNNLHLCMHWAMLSDRKGYAAPKFMVCTGKLCGKSVPQPALYVFLKGKTIYCIVY